MQNITASAVPMYQLAEKDAKSFIEWMYGQRKQTLFDSQTLSYPRSCMAKASDGDETLALLPFHPVIMLESLARCPNLTDGKSALALWRIIQMLDEVMKATGHGEAYFITADPQLAETCSHHGWTKYLEDKEKGIWLMKHKADYNTPKDFNNGNAHS